MAQTTPASNTDSPGLIQQCRKLVQKTRRRIHEARFERELERAPRLCVHRIDPRNTGDSSCAPYLYIDYLSDFKKVDIYQCNDPNRLASKLIVMGGGGLLGPYFNTPLEVLTKAPNTRLICWGMGHNVHDTTELVLHPALERFELVGIRDYSLVQSLNNRYEWVPCVSCLSPRFDQSYPVKHDLVIFEHQDFQIAENDPGIPRMMNDHADFAKVIEFLGSADTVLTSTFHGAYWSTILGKKVVVIDPCSNRFFGLKHAPSIGATQDWRSLWAQARNYPEALQECRAANHAFAKKVRAIVEDYDQRYSA